MKYHTPRFGCNSSLGQGRRQGRSRVGCAERGRSLFGRQDGSYGMQAYGKRGKDAHFPHRSGAVAFKAGVFLLSRRSGRASGRRGASERESSGLQRGLDNGKSGPWRLGGRPVSHAGIGALGLRSESCTSSRWAKGRVGMREIPNGNVHGRPQSSAAKAFLPFHDRQPRPGVVTGEVTVGMRGSLSPGRTRLATGKLQSECTCTLRLTAHDRS